MKNLNEKQIKTLATKGVVKTSRKGRLFLIEDFGGAIAVNRKVIKVMGRRSRGAWNQAIEAINAFINRQIPGPTAVICNHISLD